MTQKSCTHTGQIVYRQPEPGRHVCAECVAMGDTWVHLRMCLICGQIGCCDSSKNRHATAHYHNSTHPLARSIEPGEAWVWCYVDRLVAGEFEQEESLQRKD